MQGGDCGWILSPGFLVTVLILVGAERQREGDETVPTLLDASSSFSLASLERAPPVGMLQRTKYQVFLRHLLPCDLKKLQTCRLLCPEAAGCLRRLQT